MRRFAYERPATLAEATRLLAEGGAGARVLAGGTDLVVGLRDDSLRPSLVVDLKGIEELQGAPITVGEAGFHFTALATMREIERDPRVLAELPALAEAARVVGSVQIRNRATLAGNLCNGSPAADTMPPLLVHDASIVISGPDGERRLLLDDFLLEAKRVALEAGELVSAVEVPRPANGFAAAYTRLVRRRGTDLASVTMAAAVGADGRTVRLAYGSVGPRPFLVTDASGLLADESADAGRRATVLDELLAQATPSARSIRAAPDYRLAMLRVLAMRALGQALERRLGRAA
jgi:carbon-monoxide dehydrogenase medium subunit